MRAKVNKINTQLEEKYKKLSEVYLAKYEDQKDRHVKMMVAKGILVEMQSDLVFFHLKNAETEKSKYQQERINILMNTIDEFASIHAFNFQVNMVLGDFYRENEALKYQVQELNKHIESHLEALKGL